MPRAVCCGQPTWLTVWARKTIKSGKRSPLINAAVGGCPQGLIGFRWGEQGKWNLEQRAGEDGQEVELQLSLLGAHDDVAEVGFPYFGGIKSGGAESEHFNSVALDEILLHKLPVKRLRLADGSDVLVTSVYDLTLANYGLERGLGDANCAASYDDIKAYTPAWAEQITGVSRQHIIRIAREFADNAEKTHGRSMIIVGAGVNHWYHMDMTYRGLINMLILGCVGQSGGGGRTMSARTSSTDRLVAAGVWPLGGNGHRAI